MSFVERKRLEGLVSPSFFEVITVMALKYFRDLNVNVICVEAGIGGKLDATNISSPACNGQLKTSSSAWSPASASTTKACWETLAKKS